MTPSFFDKLTHSHAQPKVLPGVVEIDGFLMDLLQFMFPELNNVRLSDRQEIERTFQHLRLRFEGLLHKTSACQQGRVDSICRQFFTGLETAYDMALEDAEAILAGDPAAVDRKEVIRSYPGFFAIAVHRIAHLMYELGIPYLPRIFSEYAHNRTGIDIHPAARIGHRFCIDHGTGVVVGETAEIGDDVKLYQGVTLGALSVSKALAYTKRHPTIGDGVVVYAGATILGGETNIGHHSVIGGNVWLTHSVPPHSQVYYDSGDKQKLKELHG